MDGLTKSINFFEEWFSGLRIVFEKSFIDSNNEVNAQVILQKIKTIKVDQNLLTTKIKNLSDNYWSQKYFLNTLKEFDEIIGISDDFIRKNAVTKVTDAELKEIKWRIMTEIMVDYSKYTKEFYDSLKYSQNTDMDFNRHRLMITIMDALKVVNDSAKTLVDKYFNKKFNVNSFKKFVDSRLAIEQLMLRIYFIMLNIDQKDKIIHFKNILSQEVNEFTIVQKK